MAQDNNNQNMQIIIKKRLFMQKNALFKQKSLAFFVPYLAFWLYYFAPWRSYLNTLKYILKFFFISAAQGSQPSKSSSSLLTNALNHRVAHTANTKEPITTFIISIIIFILSISIYLHYICLYFFYLLNWFGMNLNCGSSLWGE